MESSYEIQNLRKSIIFHAQIHHKYEYHIRNRDGHPAGKFVKNLTVKNFWGLKNLRRKQFRGSNYFVQLLCKILTLR